MKVSQFITALMFTLTTLTATERAFGRSRGENNEQPVIKVVIVGLTDNVRSNYFPNVMISEQTGIPADSIDYAYNQTIAQNILSASARGPISYVLPDDNTELSELISSVGLKIEDAKATVTSIDHELYDHLLQSCDADYVLFLNQHYLKWQEKPMMTLFHITSYSLYDSKGQEVVSDSNNFTSMSLEDRARLTKDARKCGSNIAATIKKKIL